jgi:hypothetical protein
LTLEWGETLLENGELYMYAFGVWGENIGATK